ncbi:ESCRT II complex subunit Dot2 [Tilletia horrida]|uniref:ESCRT II complex subunit Dot2 n=1 Tax=Tilletia horrida TaxID=155126 RepID=A0AAN6GCQ4_9BASI|nr:ESCRT II complex subunit Dot2 [Tilletia horrida]
MRRGGGLAALERHSTTTSSFADLSSELTAAQLSELRTQLSTFSTALRSFATSHRAQILRDPEFRHAFQKMCASLGVDPLSGGAPANGAASSSSSSSATKRFGSMWADILPGLSDFQYDLGVQIIDVCVSTRALNGGMISMDELILRIMALRSGGSNQDPTGAISQQITSGAGQAAITPEDIARSIELLEPLGSGYAIINIPATTTSNSGKSSSHRQMVRSVPRELDMDAQTVLGLLLASGYVTLDALVRPNPAMNKGAWTEERARAVLDGMLMGEGTLWVDSQAHPARYYSLAAATTSLF